MYLAGGSAPRTSLWRLRRASSWCEGVLNTGRACPAPAKCAYPPAWPAKCAFPSLLVVLLLLYTKNHRTARPKKEIHSIYIVDIHSIYSKFLLLFSSFLILLLVFRPLLTSKSAFSTFKHHFRGGQNRFSTPGGLYQARNPYF